MSDTNNEYRPMKEARNKMIRERKKFKNAAQQEGSFDIDEIRKEIKR